MSGPNPIDFRAKVFRDRVQTGDWRVEKLDDDGDSIDEIELEPYRCWDIQRSRAQSCRH
jgi:hypothetical protein